MDGHLRAWDQDRAPGPEVSPEKAAARVNTIWPATRAPLRHEPRRHPDLDVQRHRVGAIFMLLNPLDIRLLDGSQ